VAALPTPKNLASIIVLYRRPDTLALYGLPYELRHNIGQEPRHLWRSYGPPDAWIYLGSPGWWGEISSDGQAAVKAYLRTLHTPDDPGEWCYVAKSLRSDTEGPNPASWLK
jgi:hypothetical protein